MTQEEAIKFKDEIKAFQEGKIIQVSLNKMIWSDTTNPTFDIRFSFRIKPESAKRLPTIEEVESWFLENRVFRYKDTGTLERIITFQKTNSEPICDVDREWLSIETFCRLYTHYDGSSLYITE